MKHIAQRTEGCQDDQDSGELHEIQIAVVDGAELPMSHLARSKISEPEVSGAQPQRWDVLSDRSPSKEVPQSENYIGRRNHDRHGPRSKQADQPVESRYVGSYTGRLAPSRS